jgi:hypothetical protein
MASSGECDGVMWIAVKSGAPAVNNGDEAMRNSQESDNSLFIVALALLLVCTVLGGGGLFIWQRQQRMVALQKITVARQAEDVARLAIAEQRAAEQRAAAEIAATKRQHGVAELSSTAARLPGAENDTPSAGDELAATRLAIRTVLDAQQTAWNEGDIERFMEGYWKSDQLTFSSGGKLTRSWQETLDNYRRKYSSRSEMGQLTFANLEITPLGADAAFVLGEWQLSRELESLGGNFSLVFRRLEDGWVIVHDHTSLAESP